MQKQLLRGGIVFTSLAVGGSYCALNSVFIDAYKTHFQWHWHGAPKPVNQTLRKLANEALSEVKLTPDLKQKCKFFRVVGCEIQNFGSFYLGNKAFIGLPFNFDYNSAEEVHSRNLELFKNTNIKWDTAAGRKLRDSLILSEDAKKFAIIRDIYFCDSYRIHLKSLILSSALLLPHVTYYTLNKLTRLSQRSRLIKFFTYTCIAATTYVLYGFSVDYLTHYYERIADRRAIILESGKYFDAAIEYYSKLLQRNRALRRMMGEQGSKYFTADGNEVVRLRRFHLPLTSRISEIEEFQNPFTSVGSG